jgi:hypothetical protein
MAVSHFTDGRTGILRELWKKNVKPQSHSAGATTGELDEGLDFAEGFDGSDNTEIVPGTVLIIDPDNAGRLL